MENTINERFKAISEIFFKGNISMMARTVGVSQPTLRDIIGDRASIPSYYTIKSIVDCATLDINSEWLLTGKGDMLKSNFISTSLEKHTDVSEITSLRNRNLELEKKVSYLEGQSHVLREQLYIHIHGDEKREGKSA